jgi:hypothetical protein
MKELTDWFFTGKEEDRVYYFTDEPYDKEKTLKLAEEGKEQLLNRWKRSPHK